MPGSTSVMSARSVDSSDDSKSASTSPTGFSLSEGELGRAHHPGVEVELDETPDSHPAS